MYALFRNDAMDAANPFSKSQALAPGQVFNPASPDLKGTNVKDSLTREQFGATIGFPIKRDRTFFFSSFEGLMADAQNAVPLLTNTAILRPDAGTKIQLNNGTFTLNNQQAIISGLAGLAGNPSVPCLTGQPALPAATCAAILTNILTLSNVPTASPLNKYIISDLIFSTSYRYYTQNGAYFTQDKYVGDQYLGDALRTADYKLKRFSSNNVGFSLELLLRSLLKVNPDLDFLQNSSIELMYFRYFNDLEFSANILQASVKFSI